MMSKRARFLAAALSYEGTPFRHQGRLPSVALDCAGVVVCAAHAADVVVSDQTGYARIPSGGAFERAIKDHCDPVAEADLLPGDLAAFIVRDEPQHIAVVLSAEGGRVMLLHAFADVKRVAINGMDDTWRKRLRGFWRLRGMD